MSDKSIETKTRTYTAHCDIYEDSGKMVLSMEMPGVSKDMLDVKVDGDHLIIHGKRAVDGSGGNYIIREIKPGEYHNDFSLDDTIDRNKIEAMVKNGIVTVSLGIKESEKPRKIQVIAK
jgi:HSP20 family protein